LNERITQQRRINLETLAYAADFAEHRKNVTALLASALPSQTKGTLCVLGAGNCNDLDLARLCERYAKVTLVDIDAQSVEAAVAAKPQPSRGVIDVVAPLDILGFGADVAAASVEVARDRAHDLGSSIGIGQYDTVVSACVFSQLVSTVARQLGPTHPRILDVVRAVRAVHFELMLSLLAPEGRGFFICDMVSSDTYASLTRTPTGELSSLVRRLVASHNFFTGMNPFVIDELLKSDPAFAPRVRHMIAYEPWLWRLGPKRSYLVFARGFTKAPSLPTTP
jgi:hypothetical protein